MGKMFGNLTSDTLEKSEDRVGGGFQPVATDVYLATIKVAYAGQSQGGAQFVTLVADLGGSEFRETIYVTNKKGENFYPDKDDKSKKLPLPGFTTIDDICLFVTEEPLADQVTEEKMVKIYDYDEKKEVPTKVPVLIGLTGGKVNLAILRQIEDRQEKDDSGDYVSTGKTRTINTIDKVLHPETLRTVNEYRHEISEPEFHKAWIERNKGKDRDRSSKSSGGAGQSGSGRPGETAQKKKLFGK